MTTSNEQDQPTSNESSHCTLISWSCFVSNTSKETHDGMTLATMKEELRTWLLLDNQSTGHSKEREAIPNSLFVLTHKHGKFIIDNGDDDLLTGVNESSEDKNKSR